MGGYCLPAIIQTLILGKCSRAQGMVGVVTIIINSNIIAPLHSLSSLSFLHGLLRTLGSASDQTGSAKKTAGGVWSADSRNSCGQIDLVARSQE